jgi:hypothetical protein
MGAMCGLLVAFARADRVSAVRVDGGGRPRVVAAAPDLDGLTRLAVEQLFEVLGDHPVLRRRLAGWLELVDREAREHGLDAAEPARRAQELRAHL